MGFGCFVLGLVISHPIGFIPFAAPQSAALADILSPRGYLAP
jgi:hypothetical protein